MKWLGQYIQDLPARFRDDVYLENLTTTTDVTLGFLAVDSNGLISRNTTLEANIETAIDTLAGLTSIGTVGDTLNILSDRLRITSPTLFYPILDLFSTHESNGGPTFVMRNQRTNPGGTILEGAVNDFCGTIQFQGYNDAASGVEVVEIARIDAQIADKVEATVAGKLNLRVAEYDGTVTSGLLLDGDTNANGEIDVTIGAGAASVTTVAGTLTMGSTAAMTNAGLLSVANQSNITGVGTISSGVWQGTTIKTAYIGDDQITEGKLANTLLAEIDANTTKNTSSNVHGDYIKLLPSDFTTNVDGGNTKYGVGYVNTAGDDYGISVANNSTELFAFVSIPEGMKATHVEVFGRRAKAVEVFEVQINATTMASKGTGTCGIGSDSIGDEEFALSSEVASTATNLLSIEVTVTSNSADKVYGGRVKIATI